MDFSIVITTFGVIFLAELGDKTQLTAMTLAVKFPWGKTFIGIAAAFALLNLGAVALGKLLFDFLPLYWIELASAGLFLFFGATALLGKGYDKEEEAKEEKRFGERGAVVRSFIMIFLAEMGDKTQLVTASMVAQHNSPLAVFTGSTLALWSTSLLGIFAGRKLSRFIPLSYVHKAAGSLFIIFGAAIIYKALSAH
jgi:putative Ca2+/H+ antiporter (TMEM165/GDT1 family)